MEIAQAISNYAAYPIPHQLMLSLLKDYRQPNDKIYNLIREGMLQPVKRGLYIAGPKITSSLPEPFLLANLIFGPSYVSLESALSFYGMIPERVFATTSMTTKASRSFATPLGTFTYTRLQLPYYSFGIRSIQTKKDQQFLIASPEKALLDKIVTTSGVEFRSKSSVLTYFEKDLRLDLGTLKTIDIPSMENWLAAAPKESSLSMMITVIKEL